MKLTKKFFSFLIAVTMLFTIIAGGDLSVNAATNHTQQEAINWVNSQIGKSLDYDGAYGAQCVDFIYYYYQYLGVAVQGGNGSDYAWNTLPSGWKRINYYNGFTPQGGDIGVWSGVNHVGIWTSSSVFVDQNSNGRRYVASNSNLASIGLSLSSMTCVIRPDFKVQTTLKAPTNIKYCCYENKAKITWNAVSGANCYDVIVTDPNGTTNWYHTGATEKEVTISQKGRYRFNVQSLYRANGSTVGQIVGEHSADYYFEVNLYGPTNVKVSCIDNKMKVSWDAVDGADCYDVIVTDPSGTTNWYHTNRTDKEITVSKVGLYSINVQSLYRPNGNTTGQIVGAHSKVITYKLNNLETKLDIPILKSIINANGSFTISWNAVTGADRYEVYYDNGTGYKLLCSTTGTSKTTSVAPYGRKYSYKVRAVNSKNSAITSAFSNVVTATNTIKLQTTKANALINANGSFTVSWNAVTGADRYEVYYDNGTGYKLLCSTTGTSKTTSVAPYGRKYSYKVRAVNSKNSAITSAFSNVVTATNTIKLQTTKANALINANGSFTISWNAVTGADRYEVYYDNGTGYKLLCSTTGTSKTTSVAPYGRKYSYKVRAVNSKNSSATSNFSNVVSATRK